MSDDGLTRARKRPTGRRVGDSGTREAILDAALEMFAAKGYEATSMRAVAAQAGVDPALVRQFFTDKETLFGATMAQRTTIPARLVEATSGDPTTVGRRLTDAYLRLWEDKDAQPILLGLARAAVTTPRAAQMLIETFVAHAGPDAPPVTPGDWNAEGFALAATHLLGVAMGRHILQLPVVVALSHEQLVNRVGPAIQNYLTDRAD